MTEKTFRLIEEFSNADRKDQKQVDSAIKSLFDHIEELERKAQAYDDIPALTRYLLPRDPETYGN